MWWAGWKRPEPIDLYIGRRLVAACDAKRVIAHATAVPAPSAKERVEAPGFAVQANNVTGPFTGDPGLVTAEASSGRDTASDAADWKLLLKQVLTRVDSRSRLRIWLSGELCKPFMAPSNAALRSATEHDRVVRSAAMRSVGHDRPLRIWVERPTKGGPNDPSQARIGAVIDEQLIADIAAAVQSCKLLALGPWWSVALNVVDSSNPGIEQLIAARDSESLTVAHWQSGRIRKVVSLPAGLDERASRASLARYALNQPDLARDPTWVALLGGPEGLPAGASSKLPVAALSRAGLQLNGAV